MLKLILADNQAIFRAGIAKVLAVEDDMRIVAQAQSVEQMMMAIDKFRAAVLIFSASFLPNYDSAISAATGAKTRIVVIAENGENATRYLNAGIHGVVYRNISGTSLVDCVRRVARGETFAQDAKGPTPVSDHDDFVGVRRARECSRRELHEQRQILGFVLRRNEDGDVWLGGWRRRGERRARDGHRSHS